MITPERGSQHEQMMEHVENPVQGDVEKNIEERESIELDSALDSDIMNLEQLLDEQQPSKFNSQWIREKDPRLFYRLKYHLSKDKGGLGWSGLPQFLNEEWREKWEFQKHVERERTLNDEIKDLKELLDKNQPETFSPNWVKRHDESLVRRLQKKSHDYRGDTHWEMIIAMLDRSWQERFVTPQQLERRKTLKDVVDELLILLEKKQPPTVYPAWIAAQDNSLEARLRRRAGSKKGKVQWAKVLALLPTEWQSRWRYNERVERNRPLADEIRDLVVLLESQDPIKFNPRWVVVQAPALYVRLARKIRDESGNVDWSRAVALLDRKWQDRWQKNVIKNRSERTHIKTPRAPKPNQVYEKKEEWTLSDDAAALEALLEKEKPNIISPYWIENQNIALYSRLRRKLKKSETGLIDWSPVLDLLSDRWKKKWRQKQRSMYTKPEHIYSDENELNELLEKNQNKLYTFISSSGPEDDRERDRICRELIILARNGNQSAEKQLSELFTFVLEDWYEKYPALSVYKHAPDAASEKLHRLIYTYDPKRGRSFSRYVFTSLRLLAPKFSKAKTLSFDQTFGPNDERTLLDIVPDKKFSTDEDS